MLPEEKVIKTGSQISSLINCGSNCLGTQETWDSSWDSLNVPSKSSLLSSDKSPLNYYLLSRILYFSIIFFLVLLRNL